MADQPKPKKDKGGDIVVAPSSKPPTVQAATTQDVPEVKKTDLDTWVKNLYSVVITEDELKNIYQTIAYKGFNREDVLKQLMKGNFPQGKLMVELVILCALQGPQRASKTNLTSGRSPSSYGIPASGGKGTKALNCNRICAATADLAAYYLKKLDVPKKMQIDLPGWLQFPSAGTIKMPMRYREQHIEFSKRFSKIIGGEFNEQIYSQMMQNAYLDDDLHLFD